MSRRFLPSVFFVLTLLVSCSGGGGEPEELAALSGSSSCALESEGPVWSFTFAVSGPAAELGTQVYVESDSVANPNGYAMNLDGRLTTERLDFSTSVPGTAAGEQPTVSEVPFDCGALDEVVVTFCATHEGTTDRPCWVCGDESMGSPPDGASGWVDCP